MNSVDTEKIINEDAGKIIKEAVEYKNKQIKKNRKKSIISILVVFLVLAFLFAAYYFVFIVERPLPYKEDLFVARLSKNNILDVVINSDEYKDVSAFMSIDEPGSYDIYIYSTQTMATKLFKDQDRVKTCFLVTDGMILTYVDGTARVEKSGGFTPDIIQHIYYYTKTYNPNEKRNISDYKNNRVLIWSRK